MIESIQNRFQKNTTKVVRNLYHTKSSQSFGAIFSWLRSMSYPLLSPMRAEKTGGDTHRNTQFLKVPALSWGDNGRPDNGNVLIRGFIGMPVCVCSPSLISGNNI